MAFIPRRSQEQILAYPGGTLGISAVPGSGKTHTLSALAAGLIRAGSLGDEQEVLIVTLVNSAVDNFERRIQDFLGLPVPLGYRIRTLHGLAHDIVREKPGAVGLEERFTILDEREAELLRREAVQAWLKVHGAELLDYLNPGLDDNRREWVRREPLPRLVEDLTLAFIRTAKDERMTPEEMRRLLDQQPGPLPLAEMGWSVYSDYQRGLVYRGAVDFDDLIRLALDLLEQDGEFLERLRYRWPVILEDEAQDSSLLQEQILRLLAGTAGNWVRVGDPNQAIFETFTTASPRHLLDFLAHEAALRCELPESGRCQPSILGLANQLIRWVREEHPLAQVRDALTPPEIQPAPEGDPQPNPPDDPQGVRLIGRRYSPEQELTAVVASIERWLPEHRQSTVAVLVPRNARGVEVIRALKERGIETVEFLSSSSSTRRAADRLGEVVGLLAEPASPPRLAGAYLAWRRGSEAEASAPVGLWKAAADALLGCREVETFTAPGTGTNWLAGAGEGREADEAWQAVTAELEAFRTVLCRWQAAALLPVGQLVLTLSQDLFQEPGDLALGYKLALLLGALAEAHRDWRLPELREELGVIARNERRFLGFAEEDSGFDPARHAGKVVVTTMHKAKGLEWDKVYLVSVNSYDFPSGQPNDRYIAEKWFLRDGLNLEAEALAQLRALRSSGEFDWYEEGAETVQARLDYIRERLRLLYVGITRARRELVLTWNTGQKGDLTQALPFAALQGWWEDRSA